MIKDLVYDLEVTLSSPSGTSVVLLSGVGTGGGANFDDTVLDDEASTPIASGSPPFADTFIPQNPLSSFDGEDPNGDWTLSIADIQFNGGLSIFNDWSLELTLLEPEDSDGDGWIDNCPDFGDCNAADASIFPGAPEICSDGVDQDCDGTDTDGDLDGDGAIDVDCGGTDCDDEDPVVPALDADGDGSNACLDCDDGNDDRFPGNTEVCDDGVDQDCDEVDEGTDDDSDGSIDALCGGDDCDDSQAALSPLVDADGDNSHACEDCDDNEELESPAFVEICDGLDNDCDGTNDNVDADGDGESPTDCGGTDCDDTDADLNTATDWDADGTQACEDCDDRNELAYPGATEYCTGVDLDCDGESYIVDVDEDGHFSTSCGGTDCDDGEASVNPDADEVCSGVDDNCDGVLLGDPGDEEDWDLDGFFPCNGDCNDQESAIFPGALEICDDIDNDCNSLIDDSAQGDFDGDGVDDVRCEGGDCDDGNPNIYWGAPEDCVNGIDDDCDGAIDSEDISCAGGGCTCSALPTGVSPAGAILGLLLGISALPRRKRPSVSTRTSRP